jgi:hypothetical protein
MFVMNHNPIEPDKTEMAEIKGDPDSDANSLLLDQIEAAVALVCCEARMPIRSWCRRLGGPAFRTWCHYRLRLPI